MTDGRKGAGGGRQAGTGLSALHSLGGSRQGGGLGAACLCLAAPVQGSASEGTVPSAKHRGDPLLPPAVRGGVGDRGGSSGSSRRRMGSQVRRGQQRLRQGRGGQRAGVPPGAWRGRVAGGGRRRHRASGRWNTGWGRREASVPSGRPGAGLGASPAHASHHPDRPAAPVAKAPPCSRPRPSPGSLLPEARPWHPGPCWGHPSPVCLQACPPPETDLGSCGCWGPGPPQRQTTAHRELQGSPSPSPGHPPRPPSQRLGLPPPPPQQLQVGRTPFVNVAPRNRGGGLARTTPAGRPAGRPF